MSSAWTLTLSYQSYPAPEYVNIVVVVFFFILKQVQGKIISLDPNANNYSMFLVQIFFLSPVS